MIRTYAHLAKPGIIAGNSVSVAGGFLLAAQGHGSPILFMTTIMGVALVIGSACVFNNYIDRDTDAKMRRTWNRALVRQLVTPAPALLYASLLGLCGVVLLATAVNLLAAALASIGFAIYVGVYSLYMKRRSVHGTWIGSLSGAIPPVVGYCAVTGRFDLEAALLFAIFVLWQIPHSYAIAIFRLEDYAAAGIPVLPVRYGIPIAKAHIIGFIAAFIAAALILSVSGYVGFTYFAVVTAMGSYWLAVAILGYQAEDDRVWARKIFFCSVIVITGLSIMISLDFRSQHPLDPGTQMLVWRAPLPTR